ncbi:threonylcarbamoyl-AMP synthase isoform X1 [Pteronotus mesoamericanus]|uniref:threonylcarbamoyl-AMP synthase isoform X1 n=1 Tax=Pteronotus mesoamericanus TaxID=1884717 RepID=UPI0023EAE986|nr:threonylcarbamoyl-AMP synthase isoform X1 [Pteronotus parnellii mesoamericanus]
MSPARPCKGLRAAVAASVGLSEGPAGSPRSGRLLRPPSPARAVPGARLLRLPGSGAVRAASPERAGWTEALRAAVAELRAGAVVAVPTDTLYGLACSASCSAALGAVYHLKGRSEAKPLAVCLGRVADVYRYCHVRVPEGLLKDLLPGPVTLVMERSEELNKDLNPFTPLVGIRIPDHAFMQDLAQMFGGPLALTSANLSSQASSLKVECRGKYYSCSTTEVRAAPLAWLLNGKLGRLEGPGIEAGHHVSVHWWGRGLICRGCWDYSVTRLMLLRQFVFLNLVNQAPEAAGVASHLGKGALFVTCNFTCQPKADKRLLRTFLGCSYSDDSSLSFLLKKNLKYNLNNIWNLVRSGGIEGPNELELLVLFKSLR